MNLRRNGVADCLAALFTLLCWNSELHKSLKSSLFLPPGGVYGGREGILHLPFYYASLPGEIEWEGREAAQKEPLLITHYLTCNVFRPFCLHVMLLFSPSFPSTLSALFPNKWKNIPSPRLVLNFSLSASNLEPLLPMM